MWFCAAGTVDLTHVPKSAPSEVFFATVLLTSCCNRYKRCDHLPAPCCCHLLLPAARKGLKNRLSRLWKGAAGDTVPTQVSLGMAAGADAPL